MAADERVVHRVTAPTPDHSGLGAGGVVFQDGYADTDNPGALAYYRRRGWTVEERKPSDHGGHVDTGEPTDSDRHAGEGEANPDPDDEPDPDELDESDEDAPAPKAAPRKRRS